MASTCNSCCRGKATTFSFIIVGVDVAVNNVGRKGEKQWVSATLLLSYKIFRLQIIIIIIMFQNQ